MDDPFLQFASPVHIAVPVVAAMAWRQVQKQGESGKYFLAGKNKYFRQI